MNVITRLSIGAISCLVFLFALSASAEEGATPPSVLLTPVSGADGAFETVTLDGQTVHRGLPDADGKAPLYMYFRLPHATSHDSVPAYLEVEFLDVGRGTISVQYNAQDPLGTYKGAELARGNSLTDGGVPRTAVFQLARPDFRQAQNLQADLRLTGPGKDTPLHVISATLHWRPFPLFEQLTARPWMEPYTGPIRSDINAKTLRRKVLCGYQGWFRCAGDPSGRGWVHWSRDSQRIAPETLTFEMWPDMSEYSEEEKYPAPGFTHPDGSQAYLFSSADPQTIERHFDWMQEYGVDGVLVQRFVPHSSGPDSVRVLGYARAAANRTGRVFAVEYDMSEVPPEELFDCITTDWKWLVDEMKITSEPRYLHHGGKPVLSVWGFYSNRFDAGLAHRLIDFFKQQGPYGVTLIGGCQWPWRNEKDPQWARAFRRFDVISPWNLGNLSKSQGTSYAATGHWQHDLLETRRCRMGFMPVIYPGFSWDNLRRQPPGSTNVPRLGGEFYWRQFQVAAGLRIEMVKVAMFDEVDEGTAIFKVSNTPPTQAHFITYEDRPSDWYLRLTGAGSKLIRGERLRPDEFRIDR